MIKFIKGFALLMLGAAILLSIAYGLGILLHILVPDVFFDNSRFIIFLVGWLTELVIFFIIAIGFTCYMLGDSLL